MADCPRPFIKAQGLCNAHYLRLMRHGDPLAGAAFRGTTRTPCSIDGCGRYVNCRNLCDLHERRDRAGTDLHRPLRTMRRAGTPPPQCPAPGCDLPAVRRTPVEACAKHADRYARRGSFELARRPVTSKCSFGGCARKPVARDLCGTHFKQSSKGLKLTPGLPASIFNPVGIHGAHCRVKAIWGSAAQYPCVQCASAAKDWAYDGTDESQAIGETGGWYSHFPEFYMPMCRKCHKRRDNAARAKELLTYRQLVLEERRTGCA